jgi:sulfoacetaldehyde dehydrogenase
VGAGNSVCIVDETADLESAAVLIVRSKTFDNSTSCSAENSVVIQDGVYGRMVRELESGGGYLVSAKEKAALQAAMWPDKGLNPQIVGQPVHAIAKLAGINLPAEKRFLMVEETGIGKGFPFSGEKLSLTVTLYRFKEFKEAIDFVERITTFCGRGHSCGIHTSLDTRVRELGLKVRVSRIMVRQPQCLANSGSWTNGMPVTMTLGCGSWGGTSTSANISWEHLLNYTWISFPIPNTQPTDEELFGSVMHEDQWD